MPKRKEMEERREAAKKRQEKLAAEPRPWVAAKQEPWERLPKESSKQYDFFCAYRDMRYTPKPAPDGGEPLPSMDITKRRSIRGLAVELNASHQAIEALSARFHWVERCDAYDDYIRERLQAKREADILKMHDTHAAIGAQMLKKALAALLAINTDDMTPGDVARLVDVGVKVERLSRGESTEKREIGGEVKTNHTETLDLSTLTPEELRRLAALGTNEGGEDADL